MGAKESGLAFLDEVLAHIPEDGRAGVRERFLASDQALTTLGAGALRQSDYSRQSDEARTVKTAADEALAQANAFKAELDQWFVTHKAELDEYQRIKGQPPADPDKDKGIVGNVFTREQYEEDIKAREAAVAGALVHVPVLALKHFQTFGEVLDLHALMKDPDVRTVGLDGVYQKVHGPRLAEKAKAAEDARIEAEVNKRLTEKMATSIQRFPYPTSQREPSPLDRLESLGKGEAPPPQGDVVDAAVAAYNELVASRHATA